MIKLSEISYREEDWSEEIGDRYLVNMTFEDGAYTVAAYEKMGGQYGVPDTKLRYGDINKAKKRYNDLIRKYRKMCESMKLRIKESLDDSLIDKLVELGFEQNNKNEWSKYYRNDGFRVWINPDNGDCYIEDNATFYEVDSAFKPVKTSSDVEKIDKLANIGLSKLYEPINQYVDRMSKDNVFVNGVWVKKKSGYRESSNKKSRYINMTESDTVVNSPEDVVGIDIHDDYDSIIVYSKDYAYIEKLYDLMYSYASDWADDHYKDIDKYGDSIVNTCFDYIEDKLYRRGLSDFESDFIKGRKGIDRDTVTLKDGTVVEIIEKIDLSKML